jgi:hypothetical protein
MAIKHGCTLPTGVAPTGVFVHEVRTSTEDVNIKVKDEDGRFAEGKSIEKVTKLSVRGEQASDASMPTVGGGSYTAASPHIDKVDTGDKNENAADFAIEASYAEDGEGDF